MMKFVKEARMPTVEKPLIYYVGRHEITFARPLAFRFLPPSVDPLDIYSLFLCLDHVNILTLFAAGKRFD